MKIINKYLKLIVILAKVLLFLILAFPIMMLTKDTKQDIWETLSLFLYGFSLYYVLEDFGKWIGKKLYKNENT